MPTPANSGRNAPDLDQYRSRFASRAKAEKYARRFEHGSRKRINRSEHQALAGILSRLGHTDSTLDVPCGAGRFLHLLGQHSDSVIEVDISADMLAYSQSRCCEVKGACWFIQADASRLPFEDSSVDRVFCNRLLHHLRSASERALVLEELHRIARRHVIVSFFDYQSFRWLRRWFKRLKGRKPKYLDHPPLDQFSQEIVRSGFQVLFVTPVGFLWSAEKFFVLAKDHKPGRQTETA